MFQGDVCCPTWSKSVTWKSVEAVADVFKKNAMFCWNMCHVPPNLWGFHPKKNTLLDSMVISYHGRVFHGLPMEIIADGMAYDFADVGTTGDPTWNASNQSKLQHIPPRKLTAKFAPQKWFCQGKGDPAGFFVVYGPAYFSERKCC